VTLDRSCYREHVTDDRPRILFVEDDARLRRRIVAEQLHDVEVTEVGTVLAARLIVEHTSPFPFQTVLLDFSLPDGTGLEVLEALAQQGVRAQVIGVSSCREYNDLLLQAGAHRAVLKRSLDRLRSVLGLPEDRAPRGCPRSV
jgi:CheY-like chemotaxis protein